MVLFFLVSCAWCSFPSSVEYFAIPSQWAHKIGSDHLQDFEAKHVRVQGVPPDPLKDLVIEYWANFESVALFDRGGRSAYCTIREGSLGWPGYPMTINVRKCGVGAEHFIAQVGISNVTPTVGHLTLTDPCIGAVPRVNVLEMKGVTFCGGKTLFSVTKKEITITREMSTYSGPDNETFFVKARFVYKALSDVVVRWGVRGPDHEKELGHHTFSFPWAKIS